MLPLLGKRLGAVPVGGSRLPFGSLSAGISRDENAVPTRRRRSTLDELAELQPLSRLKPESLDSDLFRVDPTLDMPPK
jgi:hypothetical protein